MSIAQQLMRWRTGSLHRNSIWHEAVAHTLRRRTPVKTWKACVLSGFEYDQTWRSHCQDLRRLRTLWGLNDAKNVHVRHHYTNVRFYRYRQSLFQEVLCVFLRNGMNDAKAGGG
jgi:hypothetical protein